MVPPNATSRQPTKQNLPRIMPSGQLPRTHPLLDGTTRPRRDPEMLLPTHGSAGNSAFERVSGNPPLARNGELRRLMIARRLQVAGQLPVARGPVSSGRSVRYGEEGGRARQVGCRPRVRRTRSRSCSHPKASRVSVASPRSSAAVRDRVEPPNLVVPRPVHADRFVDSAVVRQGRLTAPRDDRFQPWVGRPRRSSTF
jgi:hypothetical protein